MEKSRILLNETFYFYIKEFKSLESDDIFILSQDQKGNEFICSKFFWDEHIYEEPKPVLPNKKMREIKMEIFQSLFKGRQDVFARRWVSSKTGASGYSPICANEWVEGKCNKKEIKCAQCLNRSLVPLDEKYILAHMLGQDSKCCDVIGIYPLLPDETTYLLVVDFDDESWEDDVMAFKKTCNNYGFSPAIERSRSGEGAHAWFFFTHPIAAKIARNFGSLLLTLTMQEYADLKFSSYDRMIPNQDTLPKGGFGNLVALPLQGQAAKNGNSLFVDDDFEPYREQFSFLSQIIRIEESQIISFLNQHNKEGYLGELRIDEEDMKPWEKNKVRQLSTIDFPSNVEITLADGIYIPRKDFTSFALNRIKRLAAFRNPEFYKAQSMKLSTRDKSRVIDLTEVAENYLKIPRGCLDDLSDFLPNYMINDQREKGRPIKVSFNGALREEQVPASQALLKYETGVLSASTAFGKTVIGAYLISQRKINTLILVHSTALLNQWKKSLEQFLIFEEKKESKKGHIGLLGATKNTLNGNVDIAIMQSLFDDEKCSQIVSQYGMVIVDECHHVPATNFEKILSLVRAKYVYGLTATPIRSDGKHPMIFMQCGPIRYKVNALEQAENQSFDRILIPRFTHFSIENEEDLELYEIYEKIINNEERNDLIIRDAMKAVELNRTPLILTERKEHAKVLENKLINVAEHVVLLLGSDTAKQKKEKLERLQNISKNESFIVIATSTYIGEGFDEPRLDTLFLTMPIVWKGRLSQYAGRLHRNYEGKNEVLIYDYIDYQVPVLNRMYHKRLKGYAEIGYQVKQSDDGEERPQMIYTENSYNRLFMEDLNYAKESIFICVPYMSERKFAKMKTLFTEKIQIGCTVSFVLLPSIEDKDSVDIILKQINEIGATYILSEKAQQKFAILDNRIVWYGSTNFMVYGDKDGAMIRIFHKAIATELEQQFIN